MKKEYFFFRCHSAKIKKKKKDQKSFPLFFSVFRERGIVLFYTIWSVFVVNDDEIENRRKEKENAKKRKKKKEEKEGEFVFC